MRLIKLGQFRYEIKVGLFDVNLQFLFTEIQNISVKNYLIEFSSISLMELVRKGIEFNVSASKLIYIHTIHTSRV